MEPYSALRALCAPLRSRRLLRSPAYSPSGYMPPVSCTMSPAEPKAPRGEAPQPKGRRPLGSPHCPQGNAQPISPFGAYCPPVLPFFFWWALPT